MGGAPPHTTSPGLVGLSLDRGTKHGAAHPENKQNAAAAADQGIYSIYSCDCIPLPTHVWSASHGVLVPPLRSPTARVGVTPGGWQDHQGQDQNTGDETEEVVVVPLPNTFGLVGPEQKKSNVKMSA